MSHRIPINRFLNEHRAELPKGKVLEFGCGGEFEFKELFESWNGEFEWEGMTKGPEGYDAKSKVTGGLIEDYQHKFQDKFNIVLGSHVFEHCEKPIQALRNIHFYLKPDGMLILATPIPAKDQILEGSDADHIFVLNEWQLEKLLKFTGFKNIRTFRTGEHSRQDSVIVMGWRG